jgi:hypothetical protein
MAAPPQTKTAASSSSTEPSHLPPLPLVCCVLICSSVLFTLSLRDLWTTGKNLYGTHDEAYLVRPSQQQYCLFVVLIIFFSYDTFSFYFQMFMKSTDWFDDAKGWKSTQGGFSAIQQVSTDRNNMGGFFVRKLLGAAGCALQMHKLGPLLFMEAHPRQYQPLLGTAVVGNVAVALFLLGYWDDLAAKQAHVIPAVMMVLLLGEALVISVVLFLQRRQPAPRLPAMRMPAGKTPSSLVSNIVARTVGLVTTLIAILALRDLVFPGRILPFLPGDDLYLEWTNAFFHSPPPQTPEAHEHGLEAPLYIGDQYVSQLAALYILILCAYKYVAAVGIRWGADGSGQGAAQMIWKCAALADGLLLLCVRLFTPAARTASVDLRYHLILLAYEAFIFCKYQSRGFLVLTVDLAHRAPF